MNTEVLYRIARCAERKSPRARSRSWHAGFSLRMPALIRSLAMVGFLVLGAGWTVAQGAGNYLAAASWMTGIVFFAFAVDASGARSALQWATGAALLVVAWLASRAAPEFGVLAAVLVAGWMFAPARRGDAERS